MTFRLSRVSRARRASRNSRRFNRFNSRVTSIAANTEAAENTQTSSFKLNLKLNKKSFISDSVKKIQSISTGELVNSAAAVTKEESTSGFEGSSFQKESMKSGFNSSLADNSRYSLGLAHESNEFDSGLTQDQQSDLIVAGGSLILGLGAAATTGGTSAALTVAGMLWNTGTNMNDALNGDYSAAGHVGGAATNIIGMLPGGGHLGTVLGAAFSAWMAQNDNNAGDGDESANEAPGGDVVAAQTSANAGSKDGEGDQPATDPGADQNEKCEEKKEEETKGEGGTAEGQCPDGTSCEQSGDQTKATEEDTTPKDQGESTDNPMNEGDSPSRPFVLTKHGWAIESYDPHGAGSTEASQHSTAGNFEHLDASGNGSALLGTRADYGILVNAGGGHTDPADDTFGSKSIAYFDPVSAEHALFRATGAGTVDPVSGQFMSSIASGRNAMTDDETDGEEGLSGGLSGEGISIGENSEIVAAILGGISPAPTGSGNYAHSLEASVSSELIASMTNKVAAMI